MSRKNKTMESGYLAKMMASEDLTVVNDARINQSKFDANNRVLSMPVLKSDQPDSEINYEGFTIREVGKALHSPNTEFGVFRNHLENQQKGMGQIIDILEEHRTQNLVEREYHGAISANSRFYGNQWEKDAFGVKDADTSNMHFMDRFNLKSKVGHIFDAEFNEAEQAFVDQAKNIRTFEDNCTLAQNICNYLYEVPPPEDDKNDDGDGDGSGDGQDDSNGGGSGAGNGQDQSNGGGSGNDQGEEGDQAQGQSSGGGNKGGQNAPSDDMNPIQTRDNFEKAMENEVDDDAVHMETLFVGELDGVFKNAYTEFKDILPKWEDIMYQDSDDNKRKVDKIVHDFIKENKKTVAYMASQFERKKQADRNSRAKISKTGKIDVRKLSSYKTNDEIFKANTKVSDGKSHGMFMVMDMSGSMDGSRLYATIRQTMLMVMFCRKIKIPFKVYGFTSAYRDNSNFKFDVPKGRPYLSYDSSSTKLREFISSDMSKTEYNSAFRALLRDAYLHHGGYGSGMNRVESTGGTPTNEMLNTITTVINKFKSAYSIDVMNTLILTDGDSSGSYFQDSGNSNYIRPDENSVVIDTYTRNQYLVSDYMKTGESYYAFTDVMYNVVKDRTNSNLIAIRIGNVSDGVNKIKKMNLQDTDSQIKEFKKSGSISVDIKGVDQYIISNDSDIKVETPKGDSADKEIRDFEKNILKKKSQKILGNLILDCVCRNMS